MQAIQKSKAKHKSDAGCEMTSFQGLQLQNEVSCTPNKLNSIGCCNAKKQLTTVIKQNPRTEMTKNPLVMISNIEDGGSNMVVNITEKESMIQKSTQVKKHSNSPAKNVGVLLINVECCK
jgi:hypothetical protein